MSSTAHELSSSVEVGELSPLLAGYFHCEESSISWFRGEGDRSTPAKASAVPLLAGKQGGVLGAGACDIDGILVAAGSLERAELVAASYRSDGPQALAASSAVYDVGADRLALSGPLYYVEHGGGVVFADSPATLFASGAATPVTNDEAVVRFVLSGACDEGDVTFFQAIRRVPAGYVLRCEFDAMALTPRRVGLDNKQPLETQPTAVRFGQGILGADLVARYPEAEVYYNSFGPLDDSEDQYVAAALAALRPSAPTAIGVRTDTDVFSADLSDFVRTLGEPVPDATSYVQFVIAKAAGADGVRVVVDPVRANAIGARKPVNPEKLVRSGVHTHGAPVMDRVSVWRRIAERLRLRFDVAWVMPYLDDPEREPLVPPAAGRVVGGERSAVPLRDWLLRLKNRIYELFHSESFVSRPWFDEMAVREAFEGFIKGRNTDSELFWRIILVEAWAREFLDPAPAQQPAPVVKGPLEANSRKKIAIDVGEQQWARIPIRTDLFDKGDDVEAKIAGYVAPIVALAEKQSDYRAGLERPWYLLVSEKIVAISQGRSYFVWEIDPSWWARTLSKFVVKTPYGIGLGSPWTMQLAIDEAGLPRILFASVAGAGAKLIGKRGLFYQLAGNSVRAIDGPTEYSVYPANVSAKLPPAEPDQVAARVREAVREALVAHGLDRYAANLAGCVVIDANDIGRNVLGMNADKPEKFFEDLFADNPLGQGSEQTPLAVAIQLT